jgi:hypothetical protein
MTLAGHVDLTNHPKSTTSTIGRFSVPGAVEANESERNGGIAAVIKLLENSVSV